MSVFLEFVFWACVAIILAVFPGYPLSLPILAQFRRRRICGSAQPTVTVVISAYNEQSVIREKVENTLALDYPQDKLEVMVISDASEDATDEIVSEYSPRGVILNRQNARRGKSAALTQFVPTAQGEIIVFSDANSMYRLDAVQQLVNPFSDPRVGYVVGHQRYVEDELAVSASESLYWEYETWMKDQESRLGSVVGGDGAIFAIRANLFEPLRADDINDFIIPLKIITRGFRGVFESRAICYERTAESFGGEFRRKMRIVNRSFRAVCRVPQVLNPVAVGIFAYQILLHKVLRWLLPFFLVTLFSVNVCLALSNGNSIYLVSLFLQSAFYSLALLGTVPILRNSKIIYIPYYFCLVNVAAALGILSMVYGQTFTTWLPQRTENDGNLGNTAETVEPSAKALL